MENFEEIKNKLEKEDLDKFNTFQEIKKKLDKDGQKEFSFGGGEVLIAGQNFIYELNDGERIYFYHNSRILFFTNTQLEIIKKPYFIHDEDSLNEALKKTKIENGILTDGKVEQIDENNEDNKTIENKLKSENNKKEDNNEKDFEDESDSRSSGSQSSSSSFISRLDVVDILNTSFNFIEESDKIQLKEIFTEANFKQKVTCRIISDLDFNFKYIKRKYVKNKIDFIETQNLWYKKLEEIFSNKIKSYCFLFGPEGIGKTTLLLKYLNYEGIPRLYFPLIIMTKPGHFYNKKWKKICLYETIYTFKTITEMENFSKINLDEITDTSNLMEFIYSYIKFVFDFYSKNNVKKKIFVVIDDYNQDLYDKDCMIEKIINYVKDNNKRLFLCILGQGQYINKKLYQFLSNKNEDFLGAYWNLSIENEITKQYNVLKLPKYYYKYNNKNILSNCDINEKIEKNINDEFKKFNLKSFFILNKYINSYINIEDIKDEFINMPFEFIKIDKKNDINNNILIKFQFNLKIYQKVFENSIKGLLKIDCLMNKMELFKDENSGKDGIEFEDLIVEQLWSNSLDFINFPENNKLRVREIYELKNNKNVLGENINMSKPIIIRQTIFKGKYYDLLIIIKQNGKYYAVFIQIGLNKTGIEINTYLDNLTKNSNQYIKGIKKLLNIEKEEFPFDIGFMLIFDYAHQKSLVEKNNKTQGVGFCMDNNIDFLIYKDYKLFKNIKDKNPITAFEITDNTLVFVYEEKEKNLNIDIIREKFEELCETISLNEDLNPIISLKEKEKAMIINFIKSEFNQEFTSLDFKINISQNLEGFSDFGIIDTNNYNKINLFINVNSKYFSYNNFLYKITDEKIEKIDGEKIKKTNEKFNWDIYFLKKKRKK